MTAHVRKNGISMSYTPEAMFDVEPLSLAARARHVGYGIVDQPPVTLTEAARTPAAHSTSISCRLPTSEAPGL